MSTKTTHHSGIGEDALNELKAIVASVYYLESESRKVGLHAVSLIFKRAIADIDEWIKNQEIEKKFYYSNLIDSDLYRILSLLDQFSKANKFNLKAIIKTIEAYEDMESERNAKLVA